MRILKNGRRRKHCAGNHGAGGNHTDHGGGILLYHDSLGVCRVGGRCEGSAGWRKNSFFQTAGGVADFAFCSDGKGRVHLSGNGDGSFIENGTDDRGLDYQDWLKLFFLIQGKSRFCYRMMDMIQNRISEKEPGFRMDQCQYGVSVSYAAQGTLIPLRRRPRRNIKHNYREWRTVSFSGDDASECASPST